MSAMGDLYRETRDRAESRGMATAHEYMAWRTALRADYAQAFDLVPHAPVSALPFAGMLRPHGWHHRVDGEPIWSVS